MGAGIGNGILVIEGSEYNEFIRLNVHHNGLEWHDHGLYLRSSRNLVDGGEYHDNPQGIQLRDAAGTQAGNVIRNAKIYNNGIGADTGNPFGISLTSGPSGTVIYNNLIYNNGGGINIRGSDNTKVFHNTVYACKVENGINIGEAGTNAVNTVVRNNIVYKCRNGIVNNGTNTMLSNNLPPATDPKFVAETIFDFHLRSTSPAIDVGLTLTEVDTDADGVTRPLGGVSDIGAFEFDR